MKQFSNNQWTKTDLKTPAETDRLDDTPVLEVRVSTDQNGVIGRAERCIETSRRVIVESQRARAACAKIVETCS